MKAFLAVVFCFSLLGCEAIDKTDATNDDSGGKSAAILSQELRTLATGSCSQTADCYTAGMGARGCGGPETYMVFSRWDNTAKIFDTLYSYNVARKKEVSGQIGTCEYWLPPAVTCTQNKCTQSTSTTGSATVLTIVPGVLTLAAENLADAPSLTFRAQNGGETSFLRLSEVDLAVRNKLESYRKDTESVQLNVRIFAYTVSATACEFAYASCSTPVTAYEVKALKILSIK